MSICSVIGWQIRQLSEGDGKMIKQNDKKNKKNKENKTKTEKQKQSVQKKTKRARGRIDGLEAASWILFTLVYAVFVSFLGGFIKTQYNEIEYFWGMPFDLGQGVWILGLALWGIISLFLNIHYKKD